MTRKEMVKEILTAECVKATEKNGMFEVTKEAMYEIDAMISNGDYPELKLCKNRKDNTLFSIYDKAGKTRFAILKIVEKKVKKAKAAKKERKVEGPITHKEVTNFYVLKFETKENGYKEIDTIGDCATLKAFLKKLRKEKIVSLEVYKMGANYIENKNDIIATRRSAWV